MGFYLNGCACGEREEHLINYEGDVNLTVSLGFDGVKIGRPLHPAPSAVIKTD
jgi:hypothetical protein